MNSKLKVNPEKLDNEVEYKIGAVGAYRVIALIIFSITMFIGIIISTYDGHEYIMNEGSTQAEYAEFYKKRYLMYSEEKETWPEDLAEEDAKRMFYTKTKVDSNHIYSSEIFLFFVTISIMVFITPSICRAVIHRKMLAQLEYEKDKKDRAKAEKMEKVFSDPTYNPLNIK